MNTETENLPKVGESVKIKGKYDLGIGEILRVGDVYGVYQADVVFEDKNGRRLESFPVEKIEVVKDPWARIRDMDFDEPLDFLLRQLAYQIPLQNTGGQLSNSRTQLLPHQILLTRDVVASKRRRLLIADEVGLGKTIETGMIIKELVTRNEADRILIITPAGLTKNWQSELRDAFRIDFEIFGIDFSENGSLTWESHNKVIASIDTLKRPNRLERLLNSPRWNLVIFDEAHHLSRIRYGSKVQTTQNYKLAEALKSQTRDLLFLSATPHQGDRFQFWSLIQLLDDSIFESDKSMAEHRGLLNRVMVRRTKREVTDRFGKPIFMKRSVHSQTFQQSANEKMFYEALTEYLREGYTVAGVGNTKTTSEQRAIGFVMTTFQKIMSSSLRAIRQALRRRLLVLLIRQQLELEEKRKQGRDSAGLAERILRLKDEMEKIAAEILGLINEFPYRSDIEAYVSQMRARVNKRYTVTEDTPWSLDSDEQSDEGVFASADIPDEIVKVRKLLTLVPNKVDRKFDNLVRAIDNLRRENPSEKFIIFTQYLETLYFLKDELSIIYGKEKIAIIKGGPLDQKIEAQEKFWDDNGAQFLISTSAGGEGINLQRGRILFNYDLPWNPMAVEQRIGRIHRYGQTETVQVYNLIAEETVEEKIYRLLESKLLEIAEQIGKTDPLTGEPLEDFRNEVLGFLGSFPNYIEIYRKALIDRDYVRTENEIVEALKKAKDASQALSELSQDLSGFNIQDFLAIEGRFSLDDLRVFATKAILRSGGAVLSRDELVSVETPEMLIQKYTLQARYQSATFDRDIAMRKKSAELLGIGHPLINSIIEHYQQSQEGGEITAFCKSETRGEPYLVIPTLFSFDLDDGNKEVQLSLLKVDNKGDVSELDDNWLIKQISELKSNRGIENDKMRLRLREFDWQNTKVSFDQAIGTILSQKKIRLKNAVSSRTRVLGIAFVG
jgi:SNF2 family DNA or RNA helicase